MRSSGFHSKAVWVPKRRCHEPLQPSLRSWLFDPSSLTARLRQACPGEFRVHLIDQRWRHPRWDEAVALDLSRQRYALVREVYLLCGESRWVYARTVIPAPTLRGPGSILSRLGTTPLGAVLFADPKIRRGEVQVARLDSRQLRRDVPVSDDSGLWARRSLFYLCKRPLLVTEVFLPAFEPLPRLDK